MPQLAKGGKWVFGWCLAGPTCDLQIPPEAYIEYGFQQGEAAIILRGSRRSEGIAIGRLAKLQGSILQSRFVGEITIGTNGRVTLPPEAGIQPGERLLVVRGSGLALGFFDADRLSKKR